MTQVEFEDIFKLHYYDLCKYCLKFVREPDRAEEIVQEQFIALWEKRNHLPLVNNMEAYLKTSVRNRAINFLQSRFNKTQFIDISASIIMVDNETPVNIIEAKELQEIVNKAIDSLPDRCYAVYSLKRFSSLKNKEIAEKLNISEKTVENYTTLSFNTIRKCVREYFLHPIILFTFIEKNKRG